MLLVLVVLVVQHLDQELLELVEIQLSQDQELLYYVVKVVMVE